MTGPAMRGIRCGEATLMAACVATGGAEGPLRPDALHDPVRAAHEVIPPCDADPVTAARRRLQMMLPPVVDHELTVAEFGADTVALTQFLRQVA